LRSRKLFKNFRQDTVVNTSSKNWPRPRLHHRFYVRVRSGVAAGFVAILVNTAILIAADHLHVVTARGGLLTLLLKLIHSRALPIATTWGFQQAFHIMVGIAMAAVYAVLLGDLHASAIVKGLIAAAVVWLANACIVLPMIGQGFAGDHVLTSLGMVTFGVEHTIFFVATAALYERWIIWAMRNPRT
jgi:hypothetical protein